MRPLLVQCGRRTGKEGPRSAAREHGRKTRATSGYVRQIQADWYRRGTSDIRATRVSTHEDPLNNRPDLAKLAIIALVTML